MGLMGRKVSESTREKLKKSATNQFATQEARDHQRQKALDQFQDPVKKMNYLNAVKKIDIQARSIKKMNTEKAKREILLKKLRENYKPMMTMVELAKITGISYSFVRKYKSQLWNVNGE